MNYKLRELYDTYFIKIAPCFRVNFYCFEMLQVRKNEILLRNNSGGPEYLRTVDGTLLTMQCKWAFTKGLFLSTLRRKCGNIDEKRFVSSNSQVY